MRVLIIFSNPPGQTPLRLDREDKLLASLARRHEQGVTVERLHASEVDDIHHLILGNHYDVIHFSGHGSPSGIFLDRSNLQPGAELITAPRLRSLLALANMPPLVVVFLCCYSDEAITTLADVAPFVITAVGLVDDEACLHFTAGLYERLFVGSGVASAFDHAIHLLRSKALPLQSFRLNRRCLIEQGGSKFIESRPDSRQDSILINLDAVAERLNTCGMSEEELCHLLARKIKIHYWIFAVPRERCIIPIWRMLFGEFTWQDAKVVVYCKRIMKLRADIPLDHWQVWHRLLISYNDLASSEYRGLPSPADPKFQAVLARVVQLFQHHVDRYLKPSISMIEKLGYAHVLPHVQFVLSHCESAEDQLAMGRNAQAIKSMEEALTNYHEVVDSLRPPEDA